MALSHISKTAKNLFFSEKLKKRTDGFFENNQKLLQQCKILQIIYNNRYNGSNRPKQQKLHKYCTLIYSEK